MIIKIGPIEVQVEVKGHPNKDLLEMTLSELLKSDLTIGHNKRQINKQIPVNQASPPDSGDTQRLLGMLYAAGFTSRAVTMCATKVLGANFPSKHLASKFEGINRSASSWMKRNLKEECWAVFIKMIEVPRLGQRLVALGLNKEDQITYLSMVEGFAEDLFSDLKSRGFPMNKVKFGMISFDACTPKEFNKYFPKATVGRDWREFIEQHDNNPDLQDKLRNAMLSTDPDEARVILSRAKGPKELLNYYDFDSKFWRVLRSATYAEKIETDLRSKTRVREAVSTEDLDFLTTWTIIRLQYHWYKVPVTSHVLDNMRFIKAQLEGESQTDTES